MLKEAFDYLANLGIASKTPVYQAELSSNRVAVYATSTGISEIPRPTAARNHEVDSLNDLIALANAHAGAEGEDGGKAKPVVFFDEAVAVVVLDDSADRRDRATLAFELTEVAATIFALKSKQWLDQKSFVRLLRIDLASALPPLVLLDKVRKVKFDNGSTVRSEVARNRESIGKSIAAEVTSDDGDIPDEVRLSFRLHATAGEEREYAIDCAVEVEPMRGEFRLVPFPDELTRVVQIAVEDVRTRLAAGLDASIPAYYGAP